MSSGCLVVGPDSSSLRAFVRDDSAVVIPRTHKATIVASRDEVSEVTVHEIVHGADDLTRVLRYAYEYWPELESRRMAGAKMARGYTWENAVREMIHALGRICDRWQQRIVA